MEVETDVSDATEAPIVSVAAQEAKKKKKRRKKKQREDAFNIPGVLKIVLTSEAQCIIGCVAGEDVTTEKPWKNIKKEQIMEHLELYDTSSEFLPLKTEILNYPGQELLIGYIPDDSKDYEEFNLCVTQEANETVSEMIQRMADEQQKRLYNSINKTIRDWQSLGSEQEVEECMLKEGRNRIEVEVETKYPILPGKTEFRLVKAEDRRDGYVELLCYEEVPNVTKKRIDREVQVAPACQSNEAQTHCAYPSNSATQYAYELEDNKELFEKCQPHLIKYVHEHLDELVDILKVNGKINLYSDDFSTLVRDPSTTKAQNVAYEYKEFISFVEMNLCRGKMVSSVYWHPMWAGIVAISYADYSLNVHKQGLPKEDEVAKAVFGANPVLLWSFQDCLKPKLILESPREVTVLSFCKFDENVLVGGCANGQLIIWDIRNKLDKVEEVEALTTAQQKYRNYMFSLMGWMKNIRNIAIVRATAISNLNYSHSSTITGISWMDPFYEYSKLGRLEYIGEEREEEKNFSMQVLTSSKDGTVSVWDLKKTPTLKGSSYKPKKLKRLKKKPSALEVDASPYKILNMNLKPLFKIKVARPQVKNQAACITSFTTGFCQMKYVEANPDKTRKYNVQARVKFKPIFEKPKVPPSNLMHCGTAEGDYACLKWEGLDFDAGEAVTSMSTNHTTYAKFHDGPVVSMCNSSTYKVTISAGGKIIALWRNDYPEKPVLWRRSRHNVTHAGWSRHQPYEFVVATLGGVAENWIVCVNSKFPISSKIMSSNNITTSCMNAIRRQMNLYAIGDAKGSMRIFYNPSSSDVLEQITKSMGEFFDREIERKKKFAEWQATWNARYSACLPATDEVEIEEKFEEVSEELEEKKPVKQGPEPGKYREWLIEQRKINDEMRIREMIISKKQLDTKELEKRRKPLQKLEEENQRRKKKQKARLKEGENIFKETVATLFPEVVKVKPPPPPDPYAGGDAYEDIAASYIKYETAEEYANEFVMRNPYVYNFDWRKVVERGYTRRQKLGNFDGTSHQMRHAIEKENRENAEPTAFTKLTYFYEATDGTNETVEDEMTPEDDLDETLV